MVSNSHKPDGSLFDITRPGRELTGLKSSLKSPGTNALDVPNAAKKVAIFSFSVRTVLAAGTLPPPSDQNSDWSDSSSTSAALSPCLADSKNCAMTFVASSEGESNFGAD